MRYNKNMNFSKDFWLFNKPIAHRGLTDLEGFVENTLPAFINSAVKGYPIETDIRLTADEQIVCFHDEDLTRLAGRKEKISSMTCSQLEQITLIKGQKICTFDELLTHINGKVPLLIEIKDGQPKSIVKKAIDKLKEYNGKYAFISFDPRLLYELKRIAPQALRGQLIVGGKHPRLDKLKWSLLNLRAKPHFIDHFIDNLDKPYKNTICWTVRTPAQLEKAKRLGINITFENEELLK